MSSFCDELAEDASDKPRRGTTDCEDNSLGTSRNTVIGTNCSRYKFSRIPCDHGAGGTDRHVSLLNLRRSGEGPDGKSSARILDCLCAKVAVDFLECASRH